MKTAKPFWTRLQEKVGEKGFFWLLTAFVKRFIYRQQQFIVLRYDLGRVTRKYKASSRWLIRRMKIADLQKMDVHLEKYRKDYSELLSRGCVAFAAFEQTSENVIALVCFADKDFTDDTQQHFTFHVAPHQVYQFAGEVALPYRNTAISILVLQAAWQYWREMGKTESFCSVDSSNIPSLRLHAHLHFEETGSMIILYRLFGINWSKMSGYSGEKLALYKRQQPTPEKQQDSNQG